jgi:type IV pilus assembly protein PilV
VPVPKNAMRYLNKRINRQASKGIALIEALVAILILSIGILGLVGLQASMTRSQSSAKYRADAADLASEIIGTMWLDIPNLPNYATPACVSPHCQEWLGKVSAGLPNGVGQMSVTATPTSSQVALTVTWSVPAEGTHSYVLATSIAP